MCRSESPTITVMTHSNILQKKNQDWILQPTKYKPCCSSCFIIVLQNKATCINAYSDILRSQETKGINVQLAFDNSRATFIPPSKTSSMEISRSITASPSVKRFSF